MDMAHYTNDLITLKVRDLDGVSKLGTSAILFTYPDIVTIQQFVDDAAGRFNVAPNQFELVYQDLQRGEIVSAYLHTCTLISMAMPDFILNFF